MQAPAEDWRWVRFGDVVHEVREATADPRSAGLNRVVGLEHLDPDELRVSRWDDLSDLADGTSFTRTFRAGQVLFGKRRVYQRKVAVPEFDGICSSDILVFEPASDALLADFLPYLAQSDDFFRYALGTSAGSLSPRAKWQDLARFEFWLPAVATQRHIVELLRTATATIEALDKVTETATGAIRALANELLRDPVSTAGVENADNIRDVPLSSIARLQRGRFSFRPRNEPRLYAPMSPYPFVQTGDVQRADRFLRDYTQYLSEEGASYSRSVPAGTLLVTIAAVIGATAYTTDATYIPDSVVSVDATEHATSGYLELLLRGLRPSLETRVATENTQKNLSLELLGAVRVPLLPLAAQKKIEAVADGVLTLASRARKETHSLRFLRAQLRESLLRVRP